MALVKHYCVCHGMIVTSVVSVHQNWRSRSFSFSDVAFAFRSRSFAYERRSERHSSPFLNPIYEPVVNPYKISKKSWKCQPIRNECIATNRNLKTVSQSESNNMLSTALWLDERNAKRTIVRSLAFPVRRAAIIVQFSSVQIAEKSANGVRSNAVLTRLIVTTMVRLSFSVSSC